MITWLQQYFILLSYINQDNSFISRRPVLVGNKTLNRKISLSQFLEVIFFFFFGIEHPVFIGKDTNIQRTVFMSTISLNPYGQPPTLVPFPPTVPANVASWSPLSQIINRVLLAFLPANILAAFRCVWYYPSVRYKDAVRSGPTNPLRICIIYKADGWACGPSDHRLWGDRSLALGDHQAGRGTQSPQLDTRGTQRGARYPPGFSTSKKSQLLFFTIELDDTKGRPYDILRLSNTGRDNYQMCVTSFRLHARQDPCTPNFSTSKYIFRKIL